MDVCYDDCETTMDDQIMSANATQKASDVEGYIDVACSVGYDLSAIREDDGMWEPSRDSDSSGKFAFCLHTYLHGGDYVSMVEKNTLIYVNVADTVTFDVDYVAELLPVDPTNPEEASVASGLEVEVYQCNGNGDEESYAIGPFDLLHVCVTLEENNFMFLSDVIDLTLKQGDLVFDAIEDGNIPEEDIVTINEASDYVRITMKLYQAFFDDPQQDVEVSGSAKIAPLSKGEIEFKEFKLKVMLDDEDCVEGEGMFNFLRSLVAG
jgi:hypothetical protein